MVRVALTGALLSAVLYAQRGIPAPSPQNVEAEVPKDVLGRDTPRGSVLGFLTAARRGRMDTASQFLDTRSRGKSAELLAQQLFNVMDRWLPPRLQDLNDTPQGSLVDLRTDQDIVGTIRSDAGSLDIIVERVVKNGTGPLWLFSRDTLDKIPDLSKELDEIPIDDVLPEVLVNTKIGSVPLFQWIALLLGLPALYFLIVLLNRLLSRLAGTVRRHIRKAPALSNPNLLPVPVRILLVAFIIRWTLSVVSLPLLSRQFWSTFAGLSIIVACAWMFLLLGGKIENWVRRRLILKGALETASVIGLGRRVLDVLVVIVSLLVGLRYCGLNPTALIAGLGVGGLAVALAAQKTLENVVGGIFIVFDKVVRVGDTLKVGDATGTVEDIGLRSTRIRTLDRSLVSVPNGQIANLSIENFSARDRFCFHPRLNLPCDMTDSQVRGILTRLNSLLEADRRIEPRTVHVRFLGFSKYGIDLDVLAYVSARGWDEFLEIQSDLLVCLMRCVREAGVQIAARPGSGEPLRANGAVCDEHLIGRVEADPHHLPKRG